MLPFCLNNKKDTENEDPTVGKRAEQCYHESVLYTAKKVKNFERTRSKMIIMYFRN